jgi:hypothetical protein
MQKSWRNPRYVVVNQAPSEPEDRERTAQLVVLLATGIERLLSSRNESTPVSLDFMAKVSPNTHNVNDPAKTENL